MTGFPDPARSCPNGHPSLFAGQRFCEICRAAIDPSWAGPPPAGAPPQYMPPQYMPPQHDPPPPSWSGQPPIPPPVVASPVAWPAASPAAKKRGRSGLLVAIGVLVVALAAGGAFVLVAHPFGGGSTGPAAGVAAVPTTTPEASTRFIPTPGVQPAATPAAAPVTTAPAPTPSVSPTAHDVVSTPDPISPFPAISMNWLSPDPGATLTKSSLELSASGGSTVADVEVTAVRFVAVWEGGEAPLCEATVEDDNGVYACIADMEKAGVPAGSLVLRFDAADSGGAITEGPAGTLPVEYAVAPPKPAATKIVVVSDKPAPGGSGSTLTEKITWSAPDGSATEFGLYAVKYCPNDSAGVKDGTPCLTPGTPLAESKLELVKKVNGDARSMTISHVIPEGLCGASLWCDDSWALVLSAYNEYGRSVFAIVKTVEICHTCTF
jgi:hypothetical protein